MNMDVKIVRKYYNIKTANVGLTEIPISILTEFGTLLYTELVMVTNVFKRNLQYAYIT
jgi:hypothetical protein